MDIKEFCLEWAKKDNLKFKLRNGEITSEDVFSSRGLMPSIAKRVDQTAKLVFGYSIGVKFKKCEASTLGEEVEFIDGIPKVILFHCFHYVIDQIIASNKDLGGNIVVDELLYD